MARAVLQIIHDMPKRRPPTVSEFMSRLPHELDRRDTVARAREVMNTSRIRHLPILDGARLHGVLSQRDLKESDPQTCLGEICVRDVVTVSPTDSVVHAARSMLRRRVGSAIVVDAGVVVGVFTTSDALTTLIAAYAPSPPPA